jgi:uncharacterized membrane protein
MPGRLAILGVLTFVIIAVAIVSVATRSGYWALATEALVVVWFTIGMMMSRGRPNSGNASGR